jgi:RNA polymerase subunit RPABC4/transcription elongation factor Spt4
MSEPNKDTKVCEACDAEVGKSEKTCPKCSVDFEELEDSITVVSKAQEILAKRKAKETPPAPPKTKTATNPLRGLAAALRKK